jgi:Flp pilus assembly protein TadD
MVIRTIKINRTLPLLAATAMLLTLTACQTTSSSTGARVDAALDRAAQEQGTPAANLATLERAYKRDSDNPETATQYGRALREAGRLQRSLVVLAPFADDGKKFPQAKIEYAATHAAMGNYDDAIDYANAAITLRPESGQAHHILGVALDAKGNHPLAEQSFRKALETWEGDPAPVLNNLGLNLAAQGYIDQAIDTLRQAMATAPNRTEIERNLRIVSALQPRAHAAGGSGGYTMTAPKPPRKPQN